MASRFSLSRRAPTREPRRRFVLFCEGTKTEPGYFQAVKTMHSDALIDLRIEGVGADPLRIAKQAIAERARQAAAGNSFEEHDEVWIVIDRDTHPRFDQAITACALGKVRVARSNPCFELWLILHFEDFDRPGNSRQIQKHLETLSDDYRRRRGKSLDCRPLLDRIEHAEVRAGRQLKRRERDSKAFDSPSTTVGHLTSAIRAAAEASRRKD